jgi:hypothetical protein
MVHNYSPMKLIYMVTWGRERLVKGPSFFFFEESGAVNMCFARFIALQNITLLQARGREKRTIESSPAVDALLTF